MDSDKVNIANIAVTHRAAIVWMSVGMESDSQRKSALFCSSAPRSCQAMVFLSSTVLLLYLTITNCKLNTSTTGVMCISILKVPLHPHREKVHSMYTDQDDVIISCDLKLSLYFLLFLSNYTAANCQ